MIHIFITRKHRFTITPFLETWPNDAAAHIQLIPYERMHQIADIRPGLFIFSDVDRLTLEWKQMVRHLCHQIESHFGEKNIINHPVRVLSRYELLCRLWKEGTNRFRVFSWEERNEQMRYPVFLRRANGHNGPMTGLIESRADLFQQGTILKKKKGENPQEMIAVEFCDTCGTDRLYRKYSAFRIGERIIPGHVITSQHWITKNSPPEPMRDEERTYLEQNPHQVELMRIFRLANIEYGRIDYGMLDGTVQVWEINTNPVLIQQRQTYYPASLPIKQRLADQLAQAFLSVASKADDHRYNGKMFSVDLIAPSGRSMFKRLEKTLWPIHL